jgi:hypothetical protein
LPEYLQAAKPVALPAVFNGRIGKAGAVDSWPWSAVKGESFEFELRAASLGSPLDGVLTICDAAGKSLASAEATAQREPTLRFTAPADGSYVVQVRDRFASRGGPAFAYRLRAVRSAADFHLTLSSDAVSLPRKGQIKLKLAVERQGGFKEPIALAIDGLPAGVTFIPTTIPANQAAAELTFKADDKAALRPTHLTIRGSAKLGAETVSRTARLAAGRGNRAGEDVLLAVALPTPFKIKGVYDMGFAARGSMHKRHYTIERDGYAGPLEIRLADRQARHLQGVSGAPLLVPAGATEFTYEAVFPPWMEMGRTSRACVMGIATLREPDGSEHRVSFSSVNPSEQLIAVVGPGQLSLAIGSSAVIGRAGAAVALPIQVRRGQNRAGEVKLELLVPAHIQGVSAEPLTISSAQERGVLTLHFAKSLAGPFNMPLSIRASLLGSGPLLFAEAKVDVLPEP